MLSARLRNTVTRLLLPLSWQGSRQHAAATLKRFSLVEFDSAWQYMNAMRHVAAPDVQLMLFENVLEEMEHSDAFLDVAHRLADRRLATPAERRVALVKCERDMPYFLAFAHESEKSICSQFNGYARACARLPDAAGVFTAIAFDEERHEQEARQSLVRLIGSERTVRRLVWQVKLRKTYASWLRGSQAIGDAMSALYLGAIYFAFGLLLRGPSRRQFSAPPADSAAAAAAPIGRPSEA